ncbi:MAG: hypothetical protein A2381_13160 [Bdellovibrionales bacterium RIFOXYB1_FULL_37_110]|nr:MAG: hypothetical protein A2181_02485 [Bdellovibrionales bacterium RIFOXYA1_FULL_38_20]OFZ51653.1 MAG: hypothetical protein A2417_12820 [Bdellovibrionales bacterium RIFOXYC1_FULL_37_79]OFZ60480.1 MAG: hypothetical protein A2381_13160 [Bdellovibrionales bacterium RIFOXYB1_FULL_37_110]OFZ65054.1 MAG: hypothetical protein A2577_09425 [Bdellovibrionales bacterium RIFOXYD1_FULL_36_51]
MKIKKLMKVFCFLIMCMIFSTLFFREEKITSRQSEVKGAFVSKQTTVDMTKNTRTLATSTTEKDILLMTNRQKTKAIYSEMLNYPDYSMPVDHKKSIDYIESKFAPDMKQVLGEKDPRVVMISWSEKNYYSTKDEAIFLYAFFHKNGKRINAQMIKARLDSGLEIQFQPRSQGEYVGKLDISYIKTGQYLVQIDAKAAGENLTAVCGFKVADQYYEYEKMKKVFLDSNGNLVFEHQVNILKAGTYLLEGLLYDSRGKIVASAHNAVELVQGIQTINLNFYGYIFYKKKISGSFNLKNIQLAYVDENLVIHGEQLVRLNAFTDRYSWDQFNSEPFNNPVIDDKLAHL